MFLGNVTERPSTPLANLERRITLSIPYILFAGIFLKCLSPFLSKLPWMVFVQDDFFFYLRTAQNFAHGKGSTFDGITPTNGYHPLWFLVLSALSYFTTSPRLILCFLALSAFCASVATYLLAVRLIASTGVRRLTAVVLASWITLYALRLFFYGMEVTVTIPLSLAVICLFRNTAFWLRGWKDSFLLGLLIATMILSRLDTIFLIALIFAFGLLEPRLREQIKAKHVIGVGLGLIPLAIYFYLNHSFFHVWLPISGMAKQLKLNHLPTAKTWQGLYLSKPSFLAVFLPVPVAIVLYPFAAKSLSAIEKAIYPAALIFPLVYFFVLCCLSDWGIWPWYMYAFRPAMCVAFVIFCSYKPLAHFLENTFTTAVLVAVMIGTLVTSQWRIQEPDIYAAAVSIKEFSLTHPGVYAMGDRSGRVGYLLDEPLVQLEGLVMDRTFLGYLQRQTPLRTVLDAYNVRYYVGTSDTLYSGCYEADEPSQAGPHSPHMRAEFCEKPVAVVTSGGVINPIFDLHPEAPVR